MSWPDRIKNGIARRAKLSSPVAILWATVVRAGPVGILISITTSVASPMLKEMGTPIKMRSANTRRRIQMCSGSMPFPSRPPVIA